MLAITSGRGRLYDGSQIGAPEEHSGENTTMGVGLGVCGFGDARSA